MEPNYRTPAPASRRAFLLKSSPKEFTEPRKMRKIQTFPRKRSGFAYFAYVAVCPVFHIGTDFDVPYCRRSWLEFAFAKK